MEPINDCLWDDLDPDEVLRNVAKMWDWSRGGIPLPRFTVHCPVCGLGTSKLSRVTFGMRDTSPNPYRCDVSFKCIVCSAFWTHGVPVPHDVWSKHANRRYDWRTVRAAVHGEYSHA